MNTNKKITKAGLGLRFVHFNDILNSLSLPDSPNWFEIQADNFLDPGPQHKKLEKLRREKPIAFHCVNMNLGSFDGLDYSYLAKIKELKCRYQPKWISDHLCWSSFSQKFSHDLLPLPYNKKSIKIYQENILRIQDYFKEPLLIENLTDYVEFNSSEMTEPEFLSEIIHKTNCSLLLDLNNVWVNSINHGFDVNHFIQNLPMNHVKQMHLAGPSQSGQYLIDTHGNDIQEPVWNLLEFVLRNWGAIPAIIERDNNIPPLEKLLKEFKKLKTFYLDKDTPTTVSTYKENKSFSQKDSSSNDSSFHKSFINYIYNNTQKSTLENIITPEFIDGLDVYKNNLLFTMISLLQDYFPNVFILLGENNFKFFCREYLYSYPSKDHNIENYGDQFPNFLKNRRELSEQTYLTHIATLDWAWNRLTLLEKKQHFTIPQGIFDCWVKISNDDDQEQQLLELDPSANEIIRLEKRQDSSDEEKWFLETID